MVFNILGFVDDLVQKLPVLIQVNIPLEQVVGSHQHIRFPIGFYLTLPLFLATHDQGNVKLRGKAGKFLRPVIDQ